jgi:hypothetical protein
VPPWNVSRSIWSLKLRTLKVIAILKKRRNHLKRRVEEGQSQGKDLSYDKAEVEALNIALDLLRDKALKEGLPDPWGRP